MKNIFYILLGVALLSMTSCYKLDNFKAPDCTFQGTFYDYYTGKPILTSQNDWQIRIWEKSYPGREGGAAVTNYQSIPIKQDGTYKDTKLFAGTYDMLPYDGPFWTIDTVRGVELKKRTTQDFTVVPYLQIQDFRYEFVGSDSVCFKMKVKIPLMSSPIDGSDIPNIYDIRFFISLTPFCGNGSNSNIGFGEWHNLEFNGQKQLRRAVATEIAEANGGNGIDTTPEYMLGPIMLRRGYSYQVRGGANVNTSNRRYNYSEIQTIDFH